MSEFLQNSEYKKKMIKEFLKRLHAGEDLEAVKKEFENFLSSISPLEIPLIEQELLKEGITVKEIAKMCDVHVELFRKAVSHASKQFEALPDGHPVKTLYLENLEIVKDAEVFNMLAVAYSSTQDSTQRSMLYDQLVKQLKQLEQIGKTHYTREEMIIFPHIERRGITAVPTVLWTKHDEIRASIKLFAEFLHKNVENPSESFFDLLKQKAYQLSSAIVDMVFRENNIFYPTLLALLEEGEWVAIKLQEKDIGYYKILPKDEWKSDAKPIYPYQVEPKLTEKQLANLPPQVQAALSSAGLSLQQEPFKVSENDLPLEVGYLSLEELKALLNTLPFDITFIDKNDRVKFFTARHRIFGRNPSIIGRAVQQCHPPKSVHIVNKILEAFKMGEKNVAEFWIQMNGRFIHIRYFPVKDAHGKYLGTVEVVQDVTEIRKLEGEKRLLDWKE
ncbi:DUF438 domain-containing protein [Pseudothermotoga thermarum]|uniref:Putative PAS/PAC sensor protein n=1 Tax=Pseudothermotoga thermarum DSM 5069 TaxID=688269 RepID=F7YVJ1_9THEM|nr:DUF438 domain-containing protein [Pseudothermotoga thermarum]AEH51646.1 putative PAS/PAC sensor protein [Pseudothermotoga thermarum DSM 5069]